MKENNKSKLEFYTDGSSLGNPGPGGFGVVVIRDEKIIDEIGGGDKNTTNNKMELSALINALKYSIKNFQKKNITIFTDSEYCLKGITSWVFNWEKNGWKTANKKAVVNQDLWQELVASTREFDGKIKWEKVKGHSGHEHNDRADEVAVLYANKYK